MIALASPFKTAYNALRLISKQAYTKKEIIVLKKAFGVLEKIGAYFDHPATDLAVDFSIQGPQTDQVDRIFLLTLDTLRADHLGCYGYPRPVSPFLDELAQNGIRFANASTSISTTVPAHTSIFTSLHPIQHNVLKNGHRMDDAFVTIAEQLKNNGFTTGACVSTDRHFSAGNLSKGFDSMDEPPDYVHVYRRAKQTINKAIHWLAHRHENEKFFLWVHLFDPHTPFKTPLSTCQAIKNETNKKRQKQIKYFLEHQKVKSDFFASGQDEMMQVLDDYDAEISYMDSHIRRFYHHVQQSGLNANSIWILTGDHGEGLGNHHWFAHGKNIYQEQIHIPLIMHFPSRAVRNRTVDQIVEHVDIFPTIMDLTGGKIENQAKEVQGTSLVPLIAQPLAAIDKQVAFMQRRDFDPKNRPEVIDVFRDNFEEGEKYALRDSQYKYIYKTQGDDELYDLHADPYEQNNLIGTGSEVESRLKNALIYKVDQFKQNVNETPEPVDDETIERLKELGYFQ